MNLYILKEISVPFFLSVFVFTFVLLLDRIMKLIELVVSRGVGLIDIILLFTYIFPSFLALTIPMSFLLAVLLAFGRLSSDSETTAMKASGISLYQMLIPVSIFSIAAYLATFCLTVYALPWGNQSFRIKVFEVAKKRATTGLKEKVFNDDFEGMMLYVDRLEENGERMEGIMLYDQREKEGFTILAREGGILSDPSTLTVTMRLRDGEIHKPGKELSYHKIAFSTYDIRLSLRGPERKGGEISKGDREMTISELRQRASELRKRGENPRPFELEIYKKFSIPFACIVFGLIGAPLGIQSRRSGRAFGFLFSLAIFLVYYISLTGGETLGDRGVIPPIVAMWGPNIVFLVIGLYLVFKTARESPIAVSVWLNRLLDLIELGLKRKMKSSFQGR